MKVAVVGVTGMVGQVMCKILEERNFPVTEFIPVASARSVGKEISFNGQNYQVVSMEDAIATKPDVALFSAGGSTSKEWAPQFAAVGTVVIDNSSAWRMEKAIPLVVPEINAHTIDATHKIIANPNCSTIQLVMAIAPLHREYTIKRMLVSTYQSVTGTGVKAKDQLFNERNNIEGEKAYAHQIDLNCIPHCDVFYDNGYTREELKVERESHKILGDNSIAISATAVRVPVIGGHSEAVNLTFEKPYELEAIREILSQTEGVVVLDNPSSDSYPTPLHAMDKDEVFVGRIRRDNSLENSLHLWVVSDNLRKGAATNAVQIAEYMLNKGLLVNSAILKA